MNPIKSKLPFGRCLRFASANCPPTPIGGVSDYDIETTTLPNNVVVVSADNGALMSRVSVVYRAGARHETPDVYGVTHTLRNCALLSTKNASHFAIRNNLLQNAASITCTTTRELVAYTLQGSRRAIGRTLPFLTEVSTRQDFRAHEVGDNAHCLDGDLAGLPPRERLIELVHKAAYRKGGLGNSLYVPCHNVGKITVKDLKDYTHGHFTSARTAVVALGVDHSSVVKYAMTLRIPEGDGEPTLPSPYKGGEIRIDERGDRTVIAIAVPAPSLEDTKAAFAAAIVQNVLFGGAQVHGGGVSRCSLLGKATADIDEPFQASPFCESYSDGGLMGVVIAAPADVAGDVAEAAVEAVKTERMEEEDFERMKKQLLVRYASKYESADFAFENIRKMAVEKKCAELGEILEEVESVGMNDAREVLKKAMVSGVSMAAVGDLRHVPYLDEF